MRRGICIHYQGGGFTGKTRCAAGVDYDAKFGPPEAIACHAPCIQEYKTHEKVNGKYVPVYKPWPRHGHQEIPCDKRQMPTLEQIAEYDAKLKKDLDKTFAAFKVADEWRDPGCPKFDRAAVVECPVCKGRLHLSQSALNGHVWGKCETPECVSWME